MHPYIRLLRLDKPIGIFLVLWPALWSLFLAARGWPSVRLLSIFIFGAILARSAGCVINDIADRNFDKFVSRTQHRPLTVGEVSFLEASLIFIGLLVLAFLLVLQLNLYSIVLSFLAIGVASLYPFTKRFIPIPQLFLALAFNFSILVAFAAVQNHLPVLAWYLFLLNALWVLVYDTLYAMVDRADDLKLGLRSSAIFFGQADKLIIAVLQILIVLGLIYLSVWQNLRGFFWLAIVIVAGLFVYQQVLIRAREPQACFRAFLNNNYVGLVIFLGIMFTLM